MSCNMCKYLEPYGTPYARGWEVYWWNCLKGYYKQKSNFKKPQCCNDRCICSIKDLNEKYREYKEVTNGIKM